jgi:hypothetical protein
VTAGSTWSPSCQAGGTWKKLRQTQAHTGCGHLADTVDGDKVMLMNGGISWVGPNYIVRW